MDASAFANVGNLLLLLPPKNTSNLCSISISWNRGRRDKNATANKPSDEEVSVEISGVVSGT